jgi:hypothetical protein
MTNPELHLAKTLGDELGLPWSLGFERDGTEDVAVISDGGGDELVRSRPFWLPEGNDPLPPTLAVMRLIAAAPALLAACRMIVERWERGDLAEAARACQSAVESATAAGPPWDITEGGRSGYVPAAPTLLAVLEGILGYAESEAESLDSLKDGPVAEAEAAAAWRAIEDAHAAIAGAKACGVTPAASRADLQAPTALPESEA